MLRGPWKARTIVPRHPLAMLLRMDADHLQAIAARDQLWSSLRTLLPEIEQLANGQFDGSERERQLTQVLARIVTAELKFQEDDAK